MVARHAHIRWGRTATAGLVATALACATGLGAPTAAQPGFRAQPAFVGLKAPTAVSFAPDGRVLVAEKSGRIKIFPRVPGPGQAPIDAATVPTFADLSPDVHDYWDRGLLGLTVAPSWPTDRRVFVLYTRDVWWSDRSSATPRVWGDTCPNPPDGLAHGCTVAQRLSVLTASATNPNVADGPGQELIQDWCMQFPSHAIGTVAFGPDNRLYVSGGDGASFTKVDYGQFGAAGGQQANPCGDPPGGAGTALSAPLAEGGALRSQDLLTPSDPTTLDGTIIRVDPSTGEGVAGNPLFGSADPNARRIIANGLRNPFRFTFRPGTGELWTGDVGWDEFEELNRIPTASAPTSVTNFGWPCNEGAGPQTGYQASGLSLCAALAGARDPQFTWRHTADIAPGDTAAGCPPPGQAGSSSTGVAIAPRTGGSYPSAFAGALFFADYSRTCVWYLPDGAGGLPNGAGVGRFVTGTATVQLSMGPGGDLFGVDIGDPFSGASEGLVYRVRATGTGNQPPVARATASPSGGDAPLTVTLSGTGSTDAESGALGYAWDVNGDGASDATGATLTRVFGAGSHRVSLTVTDSAGLADSVTLTITVGAPPTPAISSPEPRTTWSAGERIAFSGAASDSRDGPIPSRSLRWTLTLRHCEEARPDECHDHVIETRDGVASGTFTAPEHDWPSHLLITLRATNSVNASGVASVRLDPETALATFDSIPSGAKIAVGSATRATPFTQRLIVGATTSLATESPQTFAGARRAFVAWSLGGPRARSFAIGPADTRIVAQFGGPAATTAGCPVGRFRARYFGNDRMRGAPVLSRCEGSILKTWGARRPVRGVPADRFSADWTGSVVLTRRTKVRVVVAGGVRVWIDGKLRLDRWSADRTDRTIAVTARPGRHRLRVAYRDRGGPAVVRVSWQRA